MTSLKNDYMFTVYKNPILDESDENNYKLLKCNTDLKTGDLLLIEHCFASNSSVCHLVISNNEFLFDLYHPRTIKYADTEDKIDLTREKLGHNCFGMANKDKIITATITKINHSCDPNCGVFIQEKYNINDTNIIFMEVYAIRNIKAGTEITISYGPETAHERDFVCGCGKDLNDRQRIFKIISGLGHSFSVKNNENIQEIIYDYLESTDGKRILLNHYLTTKGIFINQNSISAFTREGEQMINDLIHKYVGIEGEIGSPDGEIVEAKMNQGKLNLFMEILNKTLTKMK